MRKNYQDTILKVVLFGSLFFIQAHLAFAEANSEADLASFLRGIGDFLITTVSPGITVIGLCIAGFSIAVGDEQGMRRGALAAVGGALMLLSRAFLDFIQHVAHF